MICGTARSLGLVKRNPGETPRPVPDFADAQSGLRARRARRLIQVAGEKAADRVQRALRIEILMVAVEETHDVLGRGGQLEHPLTHGKGNDMVACAVQDENRSRDSADEFIGTVLILHQQPHRHVPVTPAGDGCRRSEGRFQDDPPDRLARRERNGDFQCRGFAPEHDPLGRIARRCKRVSGFRVRDQAGFGRRAGIAAIAAILERDQADAVPDELAKALDAVAKRTAIAVK